MYGRKQLADSLASPEITVSPGVYDGISARLVEQCGFETAFLSGAGVSNSRLARPDVGFINLTEIAAHTREIVEAVDIPIWVDADTGYGNTVNVYHTIQTLIKAGAAAVMIEDQTWPKRCGHMKGKSVIPFDDAVAKIKAADEARSEVAADALIMARTDAAGTHDVQEAVDRMNAFADAGAEIVFADALESAEAIERAANGVENAYLTINMGFGIRDRESTPLIPAKQLEDMGVDAVIYPRLPTAAAAMGMKQAFTALQEAIKTPEPMEKPEFVMDWHEYTELIGQPEMDELEKRFES